MLLDWSAARAGSPPRRSVTRSSRPTATATPIGRVGGCSRAHEPRQQRLVGFEQQERADREGEEQRIGVPRPVEEPTIWIDAKHATARIAVRRSRRRAHQVANSIRVARPAIHVTMISASGVLWIARARGRATNG